MTAASRELLGGRFDLDREIGRGAVGVVYRAFDSETQRTVALKVIADATNDPEEHARFLREGEVLAELSHPNIVEVIHYGTLEQAYVDRQSRRFATGTPFIAMEWLEGEDLSVRQRRAPLGLAEGLIVVEQVALALDLAHRRGVIHRDIKPSNIFLNSGSEAPVSSFGTLKVGARLGDSVHPTFNADARLGAKILDFGVAAANDALMTGAGAIVGTPAYMAPEQAQGDRLPDARSDIYSLGATLFELCAGRPPHVGATSIATLARRVTEEAPRLAEVLVDIPAELDELVARMLSQEPDKRPSRAIDVAETVAKMLVGASAFSSKRPTLREENVRQSLGTRLVTTLVALHVASGEERTALLQELRAQGADALPLGTDAIVAHLGARRAHGDEAARAVAMGHRFAARGARVGIATGRTRVDLSRSSGEIVDRAAKLARDAGDGRAVSDVTTIELSRDRADADTPSSKEPHILSTFRLRHREVAATRFIGRDSELISALAAFDRCADDKQPVLVSVSGPPGIGKSRLGREIMMRIEDRALGGILVARCESYAQAQALGTAADALRSIIYLQKGATFEEAKAAIAERKIVDERDLLACLLANKPFPEDVEARAARDALYVSMTDLVLGAASRGPCVICVEDAQWGDPESVAWVDHVLGRASGLSVFVLLLVRPTFWRAQPQRFSGRDQVRIDLRPIGKKATKEIARNILGAVATDEALDQLAEQAAGSPLFAEELARLISTGKSVRNAPTIEAAIQVSLDALDDNARDAVLRMSVLGQTVWSAGLPVVGVADPLNALRRLVTADLLVEQAKSRFAGAEEYVFKHGLIRDVAYAMLAEGLKKDLHAAVAAWLAAVGEDSATIAQHFDLGGRNEEAAFHWESAARRALATNSLADAVTMAERALAFADDKPTAFARAMVLEEAHARIDARSGERAAAISAMRENGHDEPSELRTDGAAARYDDARAMGADIERRLVGVRDRARELSMNDEAARCSATLAQRYAFAGRLGEAEAEAAKLLELSETLGIVWPAVDAWQTLAVVRQTRGELGAALDARRSAARAAKSAGLMEREATLTMNLGFALSTLGARVESLLEIETGLAKAQAIGSGFSVRHGQMLLLGWASTFGAEARIEAHLKEPREMADGAASGGYVLQDRATLGAMFYRGVELLRGDSGALPRARVLLERAAEGYRSTGNRDVLPVALGFRAEVERQLGNTETALELAKEASALLEGGAPSLLNEAPVFLALHDGSVDLGDLRGARAAVERAMPFLLKRLEGLENTPYLESFLTGLSHNAKLIGAAETYGLLSEALEKKIVRRRG